MTEFKSGVDLSLMEGVLRQYQDDDTSLIMILQQAQSIYGYLPQEVIYHVAERTGNSPAKVMGVATFYSYFRLKPMGTYQIMLCDGTACHVNGSERIRTAISQELGIANGETTEDGAASTTLTATAMLRLSGWRPYQLQCVADAFSTRFETTLTPQTLATESLLCALDETTVLRGSGPLPDAGAHILACFASFGPVSLTRQEGRAFLAARAVVSAFAENTLGEMECYEKALDYALPLPADLPEDADAYPECWLSVQDLQCAGAGGALDVSLTVRAEGAVLARQTASLVGAVELGDPSPRRPGGVASGICYAQPGEELFAIARALPRLARPDAGRQRPPRRHRPPRRGAQTAGAGG